MTRADKVKVINDFLQWIDDENRVSNLTPILEAKQQVHVFVAQDEEGENDD